jgi:hypothetical protein
MAQDTQPGDRISTDSVGRVRIDRVIPLPWVLGIIAAGVMNAASMYYSQQQMISVVAELKGEVRAITAGMAAAQNRDTEHTLRLQALERSQDNERARK